MKITARRSRLRIRWAAVLSLALGLLGLNSAHAQPRLGVIRMAPELQQELKLPAGAAIYQVVTASAAGKAGIRPGDIITAIAGQPIADFAALAQRVVKQQVGDVLDLKVLRQGVVQDLKVTLTLWSGDLDQEAYQRTAAWIDEQKGAAPLGPHATMALIENRFLGGARAEALQASREASTRFATDPAFAARELDLLQKNGRFEEYIARSQEVAAKFPRSLELQAAAIDGLLAAGKDAEAEKQAEIVGSSLGFLQARLTPANGEAILMWAAARLRQKKSLADGKIPGILDRFDLSESPELAAVKFWREQLKDNPSFQVEGPATSNLPFTATSVLFGLVPNKMHGIKVTVNGVEVPLAIVDTGASHTIVNSAVAEKAGIVTGTATREAAGSLAFQARAGFIRELKIGDFVLRNVPISVGNPPPLVMTSAKMAIGVDVMQHLRFTIDYLNNQVIVEPADRPSQVAFTPAATWDIPIYPFVSHVLQEGEMPDGRRVRVLIDSGNFAQTLAWPTWAQSVIAGHPGVSSSLLTYAMKKSQHSLRGLKLGGRTLPDWPVMDMPPMTLGGVDLLDLLMGHDLLSQYRVTIDMRERKLRLASPGAAHRLPVPPRAMF